MIRVLRLIFSAKTAVYLLCLMAIALVFAIPGAKSSLTKTLMLENGASSLPFLALLLLLLLNQAGAMVIRIGWFFKKPSLDEDPIEEEFSPPEPSYEIGLDDEDAWKPPPPPAVPPSELAKHKGQVESFLPAENAKSFLLSHKFRISSSMQTVGNAEEIEASKGNSRAVYTLLLHLGTVLLLTGLVLSFAFFPTQKSSLLEDSPSKLGGVKKTPWKTLLKKIGLSKNDTMEFPQVAVTCQSSKASVHSFRFLKHPKNIVKRWEKSLDQLFLKPKKLELLKATMPQISDSSVDLALGTKGDVYTAKQGSTLPFGTYNIRFLKPYIEMTTDFAGSKVKIRTGVPFSLADGTKLYLYGYNPSHGATGCAMIFHASNKGLSKRYCVPIQRELVLGSIKIKPIQIRQGAVITYTSSMSDNLVLFGLLIFLIGFIGFWFPQRYRVAITWRKDKNDIVIEGSGYNVRAKTVIEGLQKSLEFPISNQAASSKSMNKPSSSSNQNNTDFSAIGQAPITDSSSIRSQRAQRTNTSKTPVVSQSSLPAAQAQQPKTPSRPSAPGLPAAQAQQPKAPARPPVPGNLPATRPPAPGKPSAAPNAPKSQPGPQAAPRPQSSMQAAPRSPASSNKTSAPTGPGAPLKEKPRGLASLPSQSGLQALPATPEPKTTPAAAVSKPSPRPGAPQKTPGAPQKAPGAPQKAPAAPQKQVSRPSPVSAKPAQAATQPASKAPKPPVSAPPQASQTRPPTPASATKPATPSAVSSQVAPRKTPAPTSNAPVSKETGQMTVQTKSRWRQTDAFDTKPVMRAAGQSSAPPQKEPAKKAPAKSPTNPAAKPDALNLDSLFAGMSNEKKSRSSSQDNLLDDLDIDSLFDKVESSSSLPSIDSSKQEEKTAVMERPNLSDPNKK